MILPAGDNAKLREKIYGKRCLAWRPDKVGRRTAFPSNRDRACCRERADPWLYPRSSAKLPICGASAQRQECGFLAMMGYRLFGGECERHGLVAPILRPLPIFRGRRAGYMDAELPIDEVGEWVREKHGLLAYYVKISARARSKYLDRSEATYIDPYCAAGRARIRETDEQVDGSPLVAWKASVTSSAPFSRVLISDALDAKVNACRTRLLQENAKVWDEHGRAELIVPKIVDAVNPHGLHFALLDPYNLDLPFSVIECLARLQRIDLMIHLSTGTMQRNYHNFSKDDDETLELFAPGCRAKIPANASVADQRAAVVAHWFSLLGKLGLPPSLRMHPITNAKNSKMYWIVFASRAEIANKFWSAAAHYLTPQFTLT